MSAAADREREWTTPPGSILFPAPAGAVTYLEAVDDDGLAGWLWIADDVDASPRAGIIVAPGREPSVRFQRSLGEQALRLSRSELPVDVLLDAIEDAYDGFHKLDTGNRARAGSLDELRRTVGSPVV